METYIRLLPQNNHCNALILPTRDGNNLKVEFEEGVEFRFDPTYKGWKLIFLSRSLININSFDPTYKGWKLM